MEILRTTRTTLRHFLESDLSALTHLMGDASVMSSTGFKTAQNKAKVKELLTKWILEGHNDLGVWAAVDTESGNFIGWFMLKNTQKEYPEIGYMLAKDKWNQGYATEISKSIFDYAFNQLNLKGITATVQKTNIASIRVLEKIGLKRASKITDDDLLLYEYVSS